MISLFLKTIKDDSIRASFDTANGLQLGHSNAFSPSDEPYTMMGRELVG
jgi:hypothetical protein